MSAFYLRHPKETDLALFAGGEAGPFARWRIERHLETCPECERTVAEFFHLADELSVLGDTPDVDWNAMASGIHARLAAKRPAPEPPLTIPAWTWQFGAAAACALVVTAVMQVGPKSEPAYAPAAERVLEKTVTAPSAAPADERLARNEAPPQPSGPDRQLAPADSAESESVAEAKKEAAEPALDLLADQAQAGSALSTDAVAPAPPAVANKVAMEPALVAGAPGEADAFALTQERRARAAAPSGRRAPAALGMSESFRAQPVAFSVESLSPVGEDVRVGADGWISIRAVQADGSMTITDVYEPQ